VKLNFTKGDFITKRSQYLRKQRSILTPSCHIYWLTPWRHRSTLPLTNTDWPNVSRDHQRSRYRISIVQYISDEWTGDHIL